MINIILYIYNNVILNIIKKNFLKYIMNRLSNNLIFPFTPLQYIYI